MMKWLLPLHAPKWLIYLAVVMGCLSLGGMVLLLGFVAFFWISTYCNRQKEEEHE